MDENQTESSSPDSSETEEKLEEFIPTDLVSPSLPTESDNQIESTNPESPVPKEKLEEVKPTVFTRPSSIRKKPNKTKSELLEEQRLKYIFARPLGAQPRHPILSSPYARHIAYKVFGPKKPKWYQPLNSAQLYLFKDLVDIVEVGRNSVFRFKFFLEDLQDLDPTITRDEVIEIFDSMEKDEFEELDFGKFLFLLAYRDETIKNYSDDFKHVTPRQCLILSAIAYYVSIASPEEIKRYYYKATQRKATVLHHHLEATKLDSLSEKEMEQKLERMAKELRPLYLLTGSPYALPVPKVPLIQQDRVKKKKVSPTKSAIPMEKKAGDSQETQSESEQTAAARQSEIEELDAKMKDRSLPKMERLLAAQKLRDMNDTGESEDEKDIQKMLKDSRSSDLPGRKKKGSQQKARKKVSSRLVIPLKPRRHLGEKISDKSKIEELARRMNYGSIPLPEMLLPAKKLRELRAKGYSVEVKDYIMEKADEALKKLRKQRNEAAVIYAKQNLRSMLKAEFPRKEDRDNFIEIYERYLPTKIENVKNYSLWVRPAGYLGSHTRKSDNSDKVAFGTKIP